MSNHWAELENRAQLPSSYMRCPDCGAGCRDSACLYCGAAPVDTRTAPTEWHRAEVARRYIAECPGSVPFHVGNAALGRITREVMAEVAPAPTGGPCNRSTGLCDGTCPDARAYHDGAPCTGCPSATEYGACHCGCCPAPASTSDGAELVTCPDCHVTNLLVDGAPVAPVNPCNCPAPTSPEVAEVVRGAELAPVEWLPTRRGLLGISEVRTVRPRGQAPLVTWVWFTESGDTGMVDGSAGRAMAIADAYRAIVRASSPAPSAFPWELGATSPAEVQ